MRIFYKLFFLFCLLQILPGVRAQGLLKFSAVPKNFQLYPRDLKTNKAAVRISGKATGYSYSNIHIKVYKNGSLFSDYSDVLNLSGMADHFNYTPFIEAGKYRYDFKIFLNDGIHPDTLCYSINNVVAGDAFIITGQSNSVAGNYNNSGSANAGYADSFIRSFGNVANIFDSAWYPADGDNYYTTGSVGQWGLVMAKQLLDTYKVPVAIINGGIGGQPITFFQKDKNNPNNIYTNYWQLYNRMSLSQLKNNVRSIFFFQGESDGANAKLHDSLYKELYKDWLRDYKGMVKNYVVQVRQGCGDPSLQLRDYQRQFQFDLPRLQTLTANGLNSHDGCHYNFVYGYEEFGKNTARVVARDLYKDTLPDIDPLNPRYAYYSNAAQTELTLELYNVATDKLRADSFFYIYFKLTGGTATISGGTIRNNKIVLFLNKSDCGITGLSYDGPPYWGYWVTNANRVAMLSFYNIPVYKLVYTSSFNACRDKSINPGIKAINAYTYNWTDMNSSWSSNVASPDFTPSVPTALRLIYTSKNLACPKDTVYVYINTDTTAAVYKGMSFDACYKDSVVFNKPKSFSSWEYKDVSGVYTQNRIVNRTAGAIHITGVSAGGCVITDSAFVDIHHTPLALRNDTILCTGDSIRIVANEAYSVYRWNGKATSLNYYMAAAGSTVYLNTEDSFTCQYADTVIISAYKPLKPSLGADVSICMNDTAVFIIPEHLKVESWNNNKDTAHLFDAVNRTLITVVTSDSNTCKAADTAVLILKALPAFSLGPDTGFCIGKTIVLKAPAIQNITCNWNKGMSYKPQVQVSTPGLYELEVRNNLGCTFRDTVSVLSYSLPKDFIGPDTIICKGDTAKLKAIGTYKQYLWYNGVKTAENLVSSAAAVWLEVTDLHGCTNKESMRVDLKDCQTVISKQEDLSLKLYPNPHNGFFTLQSDEPIQSVEIFNLQGQVISSKILTEGNHVFVSDLPAIVLVVRIITVNNLAAYRIIVPVN